MQKIRDFLERHQELFGLDDCVDVTCDIMDEKRSDLGIDMSGAGRVIALWFTGQSDHFPGIWLGRADPQRADVETLPVFYFDAEKGGAEPLGNFRAFAEAELARIEQEAGLSARMRGRLAHARRDLRAFSQRLAHTLPYPWIPALAGQRPSPEA